MNELEKELEAERRRTREAISENKKLLRQYQDLKIQADKDHRLVFEYSESISSFEVKLSSLRRQLEQNVRKKLVFLK